MGTHSIKPWIAACVGSAIAVIGCGSDDSGGGTKPTGNTAGQSGDAGGASGASSGAGGAGGSSQGGGSGSGLGGAADAGLFCGIESCSGTKKCCPSTGKCFDPSFEGCSGITCKVMTNASGGAAGAPNCCPMNLLHCASTDVCYHAMCVGCCP